MDIHNSFYLWSKLLIVVSTGSMSFVHATAGAGAFKSNFDMLLPSSMEIKVMSPPSEFKKGLIS
jgi:hypothetical protein